MKSGTGHRKSSTPHGGLLETRGAVFVGTPIVLAYSPSMNWAIPVFMIASTDPTLTKMLSELMVGSFMIGAVFVLMFISTSWIFLTVAISASNTMCGVEQ